jgi:hypothetical protein
MEVIMVLAVIAMVVALAATMFVSASEDTGLQGPAEELAAMTKAASRSALVEGRPVVIAFEKKGFGMLSGAMQASLPEGSVVKFKRWNDGRRWKDAVGLEWYFYPSGICEALHFRFEEPSRVIEIAFNPLTGSITEQNVLLR